MQYMEFSLYDFPFKFHWPDGAANLNPLAIDDEITAANVESYVLAHCASHSTRILELGTQYGLYSTLMAHALPGHGKLVGLEILPVNAQTSNENLRINALHGKGIVLHAAAADSDGYAPMTIDIHQENACVVGVCGPIHGIGTMDVPRFTIDRVQSFFGPFDMLKMDIEGFEGNILQSSEDFMRGIAIAAIEIHPHLMYGVFGKLPRMFIDCFPQGRFAGFALVGHEGNWTLHEWDEAVLSKGLTVNVFLFKRGVHDALAAGLREIVADGLGKIDARNRMAA